MAITRTPIFDDDGTGQTGTSLDNAWKQELYDQIDANVGSPHFTGDPTAPTPAPGDNDTSLATTAFVQAAVIAAVGSWTPIIGADGGGTPTYSSQQGSFIKIGTSGGLYIASFSVVLASKGSLAGNLLLGGFPVAGSYLPAAWSFLGWEGIATVVNMAVQIGNGATQAYIRPVFASASGAFINNALTVGTIQATSSFYGTLIYRAP